jgi:choline dehydrogenase-like flavoprotein
VRPSSADRMGDVRGAPARAVDVVVAGAGMAGAATAAALSDLGLETLVVEPGLDSAKRLAGELIHPPGATDLAALGLLGPLEECGATPVHGFCVFAGRGEREIEAYGQPLQRAVVLFASCEGADGDALFEQSPHEVRPGGRCRPSPAPWRPGMP